MNKVNRLLASTISLIGLVAATNANAAVVFDIAQVGANVVATVSGDLDLAGLTASNTKANVGKGIRGNGAYLGLGSAGTANVYTLSGSSTAIGTSSTIVFATSSSGAAIGFNPNAGLFFAPTAYVNRAAIASSATWANATLASLGLTQGSYNYTVGANAVTLNIGPAAAAAAVPETATWGMMILGFGMAGAAMRYRRREMRATFA